MSAMLDVRGLCSSIGDAPKLEDIALTLHAGELVVVLGANGAGKSSLLNVLAGRYRCSAGEIHLQDQRIDTAPMRKIVAAGMALAPQDYPIFASMTVADNLGLSAHAADANLFALFPNLANKKDQLAGRLSGGERQMLSMAQALLTRPRVLLLDEPSSGLAPMVTQQVFQVVRRLVEQGMSVLMVEQNAKAALALAQRAYVLEHGRVVLEGAAADIAANDHVRKAYLGL